ncbi:MAG: hypothetical protein H6510_15685 [Acidobacteria bacterium]|nr:hypothetical protein [Acidobacteriota bacterium]
MSKKQTKTVLQKGLPWAGVGLFMLLLVYRQVDDVDVWWHMSAARQWLQGKSLLDLYLFQPGPFAAAQLETTRLGDLLFFFGFKALGNLSFVILPLLCLALSTFLLTRLFPKVETGWWIVLSASAYQWLLPRNAVFGLPMIVGVIFFYKKPMSSLKRYIGLGVLFLLWTWIHPSFLLGFALAAFFEVDHWFSEQASPNLKSRIGIFLFWASLIFVTIKLNVFAWHQFVQLGTVSLALIGLAALVFLWRPVQFVKVVRPLLIPGLTASLLLVFALVFIKIQPETPLRNLFVDSENLSIWQRGLHALNNTIWRASDDQFGSLDFLPPFLFLKDLHVWSWLMISLACLFCLAKTRSAPWRLVGPWIFFLFLALGYQRMCGLSSLLGLILIIESRCIPSLLIRAIGLFLLLGVSVQLLFSVPFGLYPSHEWGSGAKQFPQLSGQWLDAHLLDLACFTTVENGGYLGWSWKKRNGIFLDGFFAGHNQAQLNAWKMAVAEKDINRLSKDYPFELAVVGFYDRQNQMLFENNSQWVPLIIEPHSVVYGKVANSQVQGINPQIWIQKQELERVDHKRRMLWALACVQMEKSWQQIGKGYVLEQMADEEKTIRQMLRSDGLVFAQSLGY